MEMISYVLSWLQDHYIELAGTVTGLLYIYYTILRKNRLWIYGIISSGIYVYVFYHSGIYAYTFLYVYYVIIGVYGLYNWSRKIESSGDHVAAIPIVHLPTGKTVVYIIVSVLASVPVYLLLKHFAESDAMFVDAVLASSSMVATWMLTQKIMEHWLFWIVIDILSIAFMIYKGLYPSSLLFLAYTLLAIKGYSEWKQEVSRLTAE